MPLPSLTELMSADQMSPMMFQQAQNQIDLGNQQAQQSLDQGAANLKSTGLANMFAEQNNPLLVQGNQLLNESRGLSNRSSAVDVKTKEDLAPEDREKKRAEMLRSIDEDKLKSLYAKGEAGMMDPDPKIAEAAKKMRSSAWDELQRRNKATDAYDKALAIAEGKLEGIRYQQAGAGERNDASNASKERIAALKAKGANKANDILAGVSSGKFTYEKGATSFGILAAMEEDPVQAAKYEKIAQQLEVARAGDVNRQAGKVDLEKLGIDVNQFKSALGGLAGTNAGQSRGTTPQQGGNLSESGMARDIAPLLAQVNTPEVAQKEIQDTTAMLPSMSPKDQAVAQQYIDGLKKKFGGGAPAGGMVSVVKPDGTTGQIPAEKLKAALAAGYKQR